MKKIKNIIVVTDFSTTAQNTYRYSRLLAESLDATLTVVNVRESILMASDASLAPFPVVSDSEIMKEMEAFILEENKLLTIAATKSDVKIKIRRGNVVDELVIVSKEDTTDLIVIGTTGVSDTFTKLFGSTSISLSNLAHCPVLLIPPGATWEPIEQIMYASNYDSLSPMMVQRITEFAIAAKADLHFVNVQNIVPLLDNKQKKFNWKELFVPENPDFYYEKQTIYGDDTVQELLEYSVEKEIDLMCFASNHRNFWQNLVHKSISGNIAIAATVPMLILHLDDNEFNA
jgi:nucleotide-binding universal stress UspA family protein